MQPAAKKFFWLGDLMDARFGFIHSKLDIKILILYILQQLPHAVDGDTLADLTLCDDGISYFEYAECVSELVASGHIEELENTYKITEKGIRNGKVTESSLPYSVRLLARRNASKVASKMERDSMISASHEIRSRGGYTIKLAMSDGLGPILSMELLCGSDDEAEVIEQNFRKNAENLYSAFLELLLEE